MPSLLAYFSEYKYIRIALGFFLSLVVGDFAIHAVIVHYCWPKLIRAFPKGIRSGKGTFAREVGYLERLLYTGSICCGAPQWVAVWLALKVAARWRSTSGDTPAPIDDVWTIGTGLSVLFAFLGAWVAMGHLPAFRS